MNNALEAFNQTIDTWIKFLDDYSLEELHRKPIAGSWSLGQVYMHIIEDTPWHIGQMREALATRENSGDEMHSNAVWMFENNQFPDMKIEGTATDENVGQPESKEELIQKLNEIKAEVNQLYHTNDFIASKGKTRHPGLLYFSALDWLKFTEMHMRHHLRQKKRIDEGLRSTFV
jgi:hypothetical protein